MKHTIHVQRVDLIDRKVVIKWLIVEGGVDLVSAVVRALDAGEGDLALPQGTHDAQAGECEVNLSNQEAS